MDDWQPIATAPKFTNVPLLVATESYVLIGHWDPFHKCWAYSSSGFGMRFEVQPTHWMLLPEPPLVRIG